MCVGLVFCDFPTHLLHQEIELPAHRNEITAETGCPIKGHPLPLPYKAFIKETRTERGMSGFRILLNSVGPGQFSPSVFNCPGLFAEDFAPETDERVFARRATLRLQLLLF